jgi:hypothetical protein
MGDTFDFKQGDVITSSAQMSDPGATVGDVLTVQSDQSIAAAPGGGSQPVTCQLLAPGIDVSAVDAFPLLWSALQDNPWDENTLTEIPAGLGLTFAFDGTSNVLTTTAAGTWALSLALIGGAADVTWEGHYDDQLWGQAVLVKGGGILGPLALITPVMKLPSGAQLQPTIVTDHVAASTQTIDASLIVTRLA